LGRAGQVRLIACERSVMEEISAASMEKFPEWQPRGNPRVSGRKRTLGGGLLDFFSRSRPGKTWRLIRNGTVSGPSASTLPGSTPMHSLSGHSRSKGAKTRVQAAILGDAAAGTHLTSVPPGSRRGLSLIRACRCSFSTLRATNFQGIYDL